MSISGPPWVVELDSKIARLISDGSGGYALAMPDGGILGLSEAAPTLATLTASGAAGSAGDELSALVVEAISGTTTATVYDNTSASGTVLAVFTLSEVGRYAYGGDWATAGSPSDGTRKPCVNGLYVEFSGGTSRTVRVE